MLREGRAREARADRRRTAGVRRGTSAGDGAAWVCGTVCGVRNRKEATMTVEEYRVVEESYGQIAYEAAWANELHKGLSWASAFPNVREIWNRIAAAVIP